MPGPALQLLAQAAAGTHWEVLPLQHMVVKCATHTPGALGSGKGAHTCASCHSVASDRFASAALVALQA